MKKIIKGLLLFIVALVVFLIATLPVNVVIPRLPKNLPVALSGAEGSVWRGKAAQLSVNRQPLGALEWTIHPASLLLARLNADFKLTGDGLRAKGNATVKMDKTVVLDRTLIDADVGKLPLPPQAEMVSPEGKVNATVRSLSLRDRRILDADADILWNPARITATSPLDLGQIELKVTGKDGALNGALDSKNGPLTARGKIDISPDGLLKANIRLAPHERTPAEIRDMLPMIGRPDRSGAVAINQQMKIPGWPGPAK
ncbi:MAG TPA: type II secretion system protein N [Gammaproteobacteria bacterium]|nr:type II secretion system protein N [Gammaproteobacteria bacterium]